MHVFTLLRLGWLVDSYSTCCVTVTTRHDTREPLFAAEHFLLLVLRCGTACHWRLRRYRLWRPSALDSRRSCLLSQNLTSGWSDILLLHTLYRPSGPNSFFSILRPHKKFKIDWLIDRSIDRVIDWLIYLFIHWLLPRVCQCILEADRISFSLYFSAPENALFLFFGVLFFGRKRHPHFRFFSYFGTKIAVKKTKKKKVSTLAEAMHGG